MRWKTIVTLALLLSTLQAARADSSRVTNLKAGAVCVAVMMGWVGLLKLTEELTPCERNGQCQNPSLILLDQTPTETEGSLPDSDNGEREEIGISLEPPDLN